MPSGPLHAVIDDALDDPESPTVAEAAGEDDLFGFTADMPTVVDATGPEAEALRGLRTQIVGLHLEPGRRALVACAASDGVGCTFVAANLAASLSQIGVRTLLIEADLRRPSLDSMIQPRRAVPGLVQYLTGQDELDDVIQEDILPGLSVVYAGGVAAQPQELVSGPRFRSLIDSCIRNFDFTIIDTPPANTCADAIRISSIVGFALIVARKDQSFVHDLTVLADQLAQAHAETIGTVLNGS